MKLYTEEQVKDAIWTLVHSFADGESILQKSMAILTPIELPSDEDIKEHTKEFMFESNKELFYNGAKWVINKIKGGNK